MSRRWSRRWWRSPPDGIGKDAFIATVLAATDNPKIIASLAAHGHPVAEVI
jgi:hypothetical protein